MLELRVIAWTRYQKPPWGSALHFWQPWRSRGPHSLSCSYGEGAMEFLWVLNVSLLQKIRSIWRKKTLEEFPAVTDGSLRVVLLERYCPFLQRSFTHGLGRMEVFWKSPRIRGLTVPASSCRNVFIKEFDATISFVTSSCQVPKGRGKQ